MQVQIKSHQLKLTPAIEDHVRMRVERLDRVPEHVTEAKFELRHDPHHDVDHRYTAQFTIRTPRNVLRAETTNADAYVAIDQVTDRMERQIRRYHDRKVNRDHSRQASLGQLAAVQADIAAVEIQQEEAIAESIARTKQFIVHPMSANDAVEQMELLGHDFYLFRDEDTRDLRVVYRRRDGLFGVLQPLLDTGDADSRA